MYFAMKVSFENYAHYKILAIEHGQSHLFWNNENPTFVDYIVQFPRDDFGWIRIEFLSARIFEEEYEPVDPRPFTDPYRYYIVTPRTR